MEEFSQFRDGMEIIEIELFGMEEVNKTKEVLKKKYVYKIYFSLSLHLMLWTVGIEGAIGGQF